jgi:hypothetical protein
MEVAAIRMMTTKGAANKTNNTKLKKSDNPTRIFIRLITEGARGA